MADKTRKYFTRLSDVSIGTKRTAILVLLVVLSTGSLLSSWWSTRLFSRVRAESISLRTDALRYLESNNSFQRKLRGAPERPALIREIEDTTDRIQADSKRAKRLGVLEIAVTLLLSWIAIYLLEPLAAAMDALLSRFREPEPAPVVASEPQVEIPAGKVDHLIRELGDLRDIERGTFTLSATPTSVRSLVDRALAEYASVARARNLRIETRLISEDVAADWELECDRNLVSRVLQNLLANAVRATSSGETIALIVERRDGESRFVVADTGPGIGEERLGRIFEPASEEDALLAYGSGLGLHVARAFVGAHGGRIWAESKIGKGSKFSFVLPLVQPKTELPGLKRVANEPAVSATPVAGPELES